MPYNYNINGDVEVHKTLSQIKNFTQHEQPYQSALDSLIGKYLANKKTEVTIKPQALAASQYSYGYNATPLMVRFAVNGLSKTAMGSSTAPMNTNIQGGDFGDDAGMIAENSKCIVIGLADGAGGNRSIGIDPRAFSTNLLGYCVDIIRDEQVMPHQMARLACMSVQTLEANNIDGSGTLCLMSLNKSTNIMHALNIGDSGFVLLRQGRIVQKSKATMAGSSPKQLNVYDSDRFNGTSFVNEQEIASDSDIREFAVMPGDMIILASDGMFDVVKDAEIEKCVSSCSQTDLQEIANTLVLRTMKSYVTTQRDDILIMVCRVEHKSY